MECYEPYNRRRDLSTQSQLDVARNHISAPGQSGKAADRRAATTDTVPDSPPRIHKSAPNADHTVHHRRPRAGVHRARESTPRVMIVNEQARPSAREDLRFHDMRQDMKLWKQQQEIERLERELERRRNTTIEQKTTTWKRPDILKDEDEWTEEDIRYRPRLRQEKRIKDGERKAEMQWRIEKLEKAELETAQKREIEMKMHETQLKEFLQHKKEVEEREKIAQEIQNEEARRVFEEQKRREHEAAIRHAAVEDYKMFEKQRRVDEEQLRKKIESEVRAQIEVELGQSLEQVKAILSKALSEQNDSAERLMRGSHTSSPSMSVGDK